MIFINPSTDRCVWRHHAHHSNLVCITVHCSQRFPYSEFGYISSAIEATTPSFPRKRLSCHSILRDQYMPIPVHWNLLFQCGIILNDLHRPGIPMFRLLEFLRPNAHKVRWKFNLRIRDTAAATPNVHAVEVIWKSFCRNLLEVVCIIIFSFSKTSPAQFTTWLPTTHALVNSFLE